MFFKLEDSKKGRITSISIYTSNLDVDVLSHLKESFTKKKVKIEENKFIIKVDYSLEELKTLNEGYNQFHSQFILENIIPCKLQKSTDSK